MIVVFDGVCRLCNGWVQFLLRHDAAGRLRFAAVQSNTGRALLQRHGYPLRGEDLQTLLVVDGERLRVHTDAILHVLWSLGGAWRLSALLYLVPAPLRDPLYRLVARNRYRWFGRNEQCLVPDAALAARFLD